MFKARYKCQIIFIIIGIKQKCEIIQYGFLLCDNISSCLFSNRSHAGVHETAGQNLLGSFLKKAIEYRETEGRLYTVAEV